MMAAIGASLQLLPVATARPVASPRPLALLWWLYAPAVALLVVGMAGSMPALLAAGAAAVGLALLLYAGLLAANLKGARGLPVVVLHSAVALVSLGVLLLGAGSLAAAYLGVAMLARQDAMLLHVVFAGYGFMAALVLGFSYILVPMFALSESPPQRPALFSAACAVGGLSCTAGAALGLAPAWLLPLAVLAGALALAVYLRLMVQALRTGLRRALGRTFVLVRVGWAALAASLAAALVLVLVQGLGLDATLPLSRLRTLFGVLLVGALLSFLLGMLGRIVPFLASMHAPPGPRGPALPSALTAERPLAIHFHCHLTAMALLLLAVAADSAWLARAAATVGLTGALAFGRFFWVAYRRMRPAQTAPAGPDLS
ncbi:MAG: hypothetical protein HY021_00655 [Burkholderiales bacterium]|nr:hypothetical protein [Burkholderiales bacterium]